MAKQTIAPNNINRVITFYSYKGGVGRSLALANISVILAQWGYKTLIIDWDLEAPGLENFFTDYIDKKTVLNKPGLIDLLNLKTAANTVDVNAIEWHNYITPVNIGGDAVLHLMSAGRRDDNFIKNVKQFDYTNFYQHADGGQFLENLRELCLDNYNFILIDSRTGLTDSSGICSIHMPDVLLLLFTPNEQSFYGIKNVAKKAIEGQKQIIYDRFKLRTLPVPSRIEYQETTMLDEWMNRICNESDEMMEWLPKKGDRRTEFLISPQQLINHIKIPYRTFYAYGEKLAVKERGTQDPLDIGYAYETIAAVLANDFQNIDLLADSRDSYIKKAKGLDFTDDTSFKNQIEKQEEEKKILEDKLNQQQSQAKKRSSIAWFVILLLFAGLLTAIFVLPLFKKTAVEVNGDNPVNAGDSVALKTAYLTFRSKYIAADTNRYELKTNLTFLSDYFKLNKKYQDSAIDVKANIESVIFDNAALFLKKYYNSLQNKSFTAAEFFADTIINFGSLQNTTPLVLQNITDSIKRTKTIRNNFSENTAFKYTTDSAGIHITYAEKGNFLIDTRQEYKDMQNAVEILLSFDFKIKSFTYTTIKGSPLVVDKPAVEVFFAVPPILK